MKKARKELSPQELEKKDIEKKERRKRLADMRRMGKYQEDKGWIVAATRDDYDRCDELREIIAKKPITNEEDAQIKKLAQEELELVSKRIENTEIIQRNRQEKAVAAKKQAEDEEMERQRIALERRKLEEELVARRKAENEEKEKQEILAEMKAREEKVRLAVEKAERDKQSLKTAEKEKLKSSRLSEKTEVELPRVKVREAEKLKVQEKKFWTDVISDEEEESLDGETDKEDDFEGIHVMKNTIMEVKASLPGPSRAPTDAEQTQVDSEVVDTVDELKNVGEYDDFVKRVLDIQEEIVEITPAKDCRKEVGRSIRKEVRNLLEVVIKQQKALIYFKAKYEELIRQKATVEVKESYADKLKKGVEGKVDMRVRNRPRSPPQLTVTIYPNEESTSRESKQEICKEIDIGKLKEGVRGVRMVRNSGIVVEVENGDDVEELIKCIEEHPIVGEKYSAKKTPKRLPQIVIYNVNEDYEEEQMKKEIIERNDAFKKEEDIVIRKKYKGRTGNNWVLELKPKVFNEIIKVKKIYLGWQRYK